MKKTAMQQLIEFMHGAYSLHDIHKKATELLETEREQIEEAYDEGYKDAEQDMQQDKQTCGFCVNKNHYI